MGIGKKKFGLKSWRTARAALVLKEEGRGF